MRVNQGQEFVVGGYSKDNPFDALILRVLRGWQVALCGANTCRLSPVMRASVFRKFKALEITECPFREAATEEVTTVGRRFDEGEDEGLRVAAAAARRANLFLEWAPDGNLRHTKFLGLRDDKDPRAIVRER